MVLVDMFVFINKIRKNNEIALKVTSSVDLDIVYKSTNVVRVNYCEILFSCLSNIK